MVFKGDAKPDQTLVTEDAADDEEMLRDLKAAGCTAEELNDFGTKL